MISPLWVFSALAESHRAPFDFSERESELVSGYNTEYSGGLFAFIFLREYCSLLFSCVVIFFLFLYFPPAIGILPVIAYGIGTVIVSLFFIVIRVTYCRFRYDFLIILA